MWSLSNRLFFIFLAFLAFPLHAEKSAKRSVAIAVIDYDKILSEAPDFVRAKKVFEKKRAQFYKELGDLEKKLSKDNKKLVTLQKTDPKTFSKTKEKFEAELRQAHEKLHARKKTLLAIAEREQGKARESFQSALNTVSKDNNIQLVLTRVMGGIPIVLYNTPPMDITSKVLDAMSAQVIARKKTKETPDAK